MNPDHQDLWFLPLGGCGEIGMNLNLYGHDDQWVMIDCGVTFRDADGTRRSGFDMQMADVSFIEARRDTLQGLLLTHAHEDHIGAVPWLWPKLRCPVFADRFTAAMLRRKLVEHGLEHKVPIHEIVPGQQHQLGVFDIQWIAHTHSVPNPCGIALYTPAGSVFHSADWKLDPAPQVGHHFSQQTYESLGQRRIDVLVCDSTCATVPGHSVSEGALYDGLRAIVAAASGRVVVACFGSNIARLHTLARIATETGRDLGLLGRSLINTVSVARSTGLWEHSRTLVASEHLGYLPRDSLLLVATGSQGEARTALNRLSRDNFAHLSLEAGDTVVFSARAIPGNEADIAALIDRLTTRGIHIVTPDTSELPIHASGHPAADELVQFYEWIKPRVVIPVHGEDEHLDAQVSLARRAGVDRTLRGRNGDLFVLAPDKAVRRDVVAAGRMGVDRKGQLGKIG